MLHAFLMNDVVGNTLNRFSTRFPRQGFQIYPGAVVFGRQNSLRSTCGVQQVAQQRCWQRCPRHTWPG
jgi:hypothetical protein